MDTDSFSHSVNNQKKLHMSTQSSLERSTSPLREYNQNHEQTQMNMTNTEHTVAEKTLNVKDLEQSRYPEPTEIDKFIQNAKQIQECINEAMT